MDYTSLEAKETKDSGVIYIFFFLSKVLQELYILKKKKKKPLSEFYIQQENPSEIKVKYFQINKSEKFISSVTHYKCQRKLFRLKKK